jgi:pyruvate dehydrogenase E2 component (dihydrolipoamide acetyltransferase)
MIQEIKLPDLGEGIEGAEVSEVMVAIGATVRPDDTVLVLESDKTSIEIPAETRGTVLEILVVAGDEVKTGHLLMKIEVSGETLEPQTQTEEKPTEEKLAPLLDKKTSEPVFTEKISENTFFASPGVRRLSRELEINLETIKGTGVKGRITKDDLNAYIKLQMALSSGPLPAPKKEIDFSQWGEVEVQKLTRIKRITGEMIQREWQSIPHVTQFDEADVTELEAYRKVLKKRGAEKGIKVTFLPFLMKAVALVLKEIPEFNSSLDSTDQNLVLKKYYHFGVAVDTPNGLTVPVVRDVDQKSIFDLSEDLMDLSTRARNKKLKPGEMTGGTFTLSSLGGIGGTAFSPIVNPPEVAILGVSKSKWKQTHDKSTGKFQPKFLMPFSLSYDHRVIDGAAAAHFTTRLSSILSDLTQFKE